MCYWDISGSRRRRIGDSALTAQLETGRQRTRKHKRVRKHPISSNLRPTSSFGTFLFYVQMSNYLCSFSSGRLEAVLSERLPAASLIRSYSFKDAPSVRSASFLFYTLRSLKSHFNICKSETTRCLWGNLWTVSSREYLRWHQVVLTRHRRRLQEVFCS